MHGPASAPSCMISTRSTRLAGRRHQFELSVAVGEQDAGGGRVEESRQRPRAIAAGRPRRSRRRGCRRVFANVCSSRASAWSSVITSPRSRRAARGTPGGRRRSSCATSIIVRLVANAWPWIIEPGIVGRDVELCEHHAGRLVHDAPGVRRCRRRRRSRARGAERLPQDVAPDDAGHASTPRWISLASSSTGPREYRSTAPSRSGPDDQGEGEDRAHRLVARPPRRMPATVAARRLQVGSATGPAGAHRIPARALTQVELQFVEAGGERVARGERLAAEHVAQRRDGGAGHGKQVEERAAELCWGTGGPVQCLQRCTERTRHHAIASRLRRYPSPVAM